MGPTIRAEWLKIRSTRSAYVIAALTVSGIGLAALLAWQGVQGWDQLAPAQRVHFQAPPMEQVLLPLVQLALGVLGAIAVTSEYATGMIRSSLLAVPRRWPLLTAKALVVTAIALALGEAFVFGTFGVSHWIVGTRPIPGNTAGLAIEWPVLVGLGVSVAVVALVGIGLGAITRAATPAVAAVCALLFMLPELSHLLPAPWGPRLEAVLPTPLGMEVAASPHGAILTPATAAAVFCAYVVVPLGAGLLLLARRDA